MKLENIVANGEIAQNDQLHSLLQCFQSPLRFGKGERPTERRNKATDSKLNTLLK